MKIKKPLCYLMFDRGTTRLSGTSNQPHSRVKHFNEVIGGIRTQIREAKIIQGGLSSPFWLEHDGEAGIAGGVRIEPTEFDEKKADVRTNLWGAGFKGGEIEHMISQCHTTSDLEKLIGKKPTQTK